jgi:hypothetical protein
VCAALNRGDEVLQSTGAAQQRGPLCEIATKLARRNEDATVRKRHHLTRLVYGKARGWWVRIARDGQIHSKMFSDATCGGCRKAELAARQWRDELLSKLGPSQAKKGKPPGPESHLRPTNTSGVIGVHRLQKLVRYFNVTEGRWIEHKAPYWAAGWHDLDGRQREKSYSVKKYGENGAKKKATAYRRQKVREIRAAMATSGG